MSKTVRFLNWSDGTEWDVTLDGCEDMKVNYSLRKESKAKAGYKAVTVHDSFNDSSSDRRAAERGHFSRHSDGPGEDRVIVVNHILVFVLG